MEEDGQDDYFLFDCPGRHSIIVLLSMFFACVHVCEVLSLIHVKNCCHFINLPLCSFPLSLLSLPLSSSSPLPLGQIELNTHIPVMSQILDQLDRFGFRLCAVFLLDSAFLTSTISGILTTLSSMVTLKLPQVNVLSKIDLLPSQYKSEL